MATPAFPFGAPDVQTPTYAASIALAITNPLTIVDIAATGALTLTVAAVSTYTLRAGDRIVLTVGSDTTARDTTFSTGFQSPVLAGVISKKKTIELVYNPTQAKFIPTSVGVQIN